MLALHKLIKYSNLIQILQKRGVEHYKNSKRRQFLKGLKKFVEYLLYNIYFRHKKKLLIANEKFIKLKRLNITRNAFSNWNKKYALLHKNFQLFCILAIKIKKAILVKLFDDNLF